jgi:hypothetical protein
MKFSFKFTLILVVLLLAGVVILATVYFKSQSVKPKNNNQTTLPVVNQAEGQLIAGFPDFPIFTGASITSTQHTNAVNAPTYQPASYQAYLESTKSVTEIIAWYTQNLQKMGWQVTTPADQTDLNDKNILAVKGKLKATVNVEKENNTATIAIYIR